MKIMFCGVMVIILVLLSSCSVSETNSTKQKVTEPNLTQAITTSSKSNSKRQKTKSTKPSVTQPNTTQAVTTSSKPNSKSEKTQSPKITNTKAKKNKTSKKKYKNYKDIPGYKEYISDRNKGEVTSFCGMMSSLFNSEKARMYYKKMLEKQETF